MPPVTPDVGRATSETGRPRLPAKERREVILRAALHVFAERGFDSATLRAIAQRSASTTPIVYRHFDSKAALHRAVVQNAGASLIAVWASTPPGGSIETVFLQATAPFFLWIENHRAEWSILFVDQPTNAVARATLDAIRGSANEAMGQLIAQLPLTCPQGVADEVFRSALASQITGAGNALSLWWWDHQHVPAASIAAMNHALVWKGLSELTEG